MMVYRRLACTVRGAHSAPKTIRALNLGFKGAAANLGDGLMVKIPCTTCTNPCPTCNGMKNYRATGGWIFISLYGTRDSILRAHLGRFQKHSKSCQLCMSI